MGFIQLNRSTKTGMKKIFIAIDKIISVQEAQVQTDTQKTVLVLIDKTLLHVFDDFESVAQKLSLIGKY